MKAALRLLMVGLVLLNFAEIGRAQQSEEYHVKAAFLFHFAQLVEWPADALGDDKNPITLCTFGKDPFGGDLDTTLQGKSVGTRPLRIRHAKQIQEIPGCQLLFVGGNERKELPPLLAALKDSPVLTIGESDEFAKQGGMIGFSMDNNKVRFDINVDAAGRAKLKISSRLLLLAKSVIGKQP
ncbi:MAG: YfiR family protein [Candidatus Sulfotelmatobacter sp.]